MSNSASKILKEALRLSEEDRAALAAGLLESLASPGSPDNMDNISDEQWHAETERRARQVLDGEPGIPWEQVEGRVRQRLHST